MKLVSLELSAEEAKEDGGVSPSTGNDGDLPKYPYGTRIDLSDALVEKVGLGDCKVGDEVVIQARGRITSYSMNEERDGDENCRVGIQITEMGVDMDGGAEKARKADDRLNELSGTKGRDAY